jgi:hypothetical protein
MPAKVIGRGHRRENVKKDVDVVHDPTAIDDEMSLGSRALRRRTVSLGAQPAVKEMRTCRE